MHYNKINRPLGESRQTTAERLRKSLIPANQDWQEKVGAVTIVDAPNPAGGFTKFTFVGAPPLETIKEAITSTFSWQSALREFYKGKPMPRVMNNVMTVKRNPLRGPDIVINAKASAEYAGV